MPTYILIITEVAILFLVNSVLPFATTGKMFYSRTIKSNGFWNIKISKAKLLPLRGLLIREFIFFWRGNKLGILKLILLTLFINGILILFIVNNNKESFFVWAIAIQFVIVLQFVMQYPSINNIELQKTIPCNSISILVAEYIFWAVILFIQFSVVVSFYYFALSQIDILFVTKLFGFFQILLVYVLTIRLAYSENSFLRSIIYYLIFIPLTIPFFIYNSYRRLKC